MNPTPLPIRVLVVDDHPLVRHALSMVISAEADLEVVGEAADGRAAVALAQQLQPTVVVMDLLMPVQDGVSAIAELQAVCPETRVLALSSAVEESMVLDAVRAGARGYLAKDAQIAELLRGVREVGQGRWFFPHHIAGRLAASLRFPPGSPAAGPANLERPPTGRTISLPTEDRLTPREQQVLRLLSRGRTNREIAAELAISYHTAGVHVHNIMQKLGLKSRGEVVAHAARLGPNP